MAPSGPPIQFHHSVCLIDVIVGAGGRMSSISTTVVMIVPQMENVAA